MSDKAHSFGFLQELESLLNGKLGSPAGSQILRSLCHRHAGAEIKIPLETHFYKKQRNGQIRKRYNGSNLAELAIEFEIHPETVRKIINAPR